MAGGGTTRAQTLDQQYQIVIMTRVLVVEDDVLQRDALVNDLHAAGHEVVQCANGREAMAALEASDPRFGWLFTDIRLAGLLDGWAIADRARALNPGNCPTAATSPSPMRRLWCSVISQNWRAEAAPSVRSNASIEADPEGFAQLPLEDFA